MARIGKYLGRMAHVAEGIDGFGAPVRIRTLEMLYAPSVHRFCGHSDGLQAAEPVTQQTSNRSRIAAQPASPRDAENGSQGMKGNSHDALHKASPTRIKLTQPPEIGREITIINRDAVLRPIMAERQGTGRCNH